MTCPRVRPLIRVLVILGFPLALIHLQIGIPARGQPTYKLDVKPDLKPRATLRLEANRVVRTDLADDPGFRLQYHVRSADGKTALVAEARSAAFLGLPVKAPGPFNVVLELFYPTYKGGNAQKGEFKPVSNVLTYKVDGGKVVLVDTPTPKKETPPPAKKP